MIAVVEAVIGLRDGNSEKICVSNWPELFDRLKDLDIKMFTASEIKLEQMRQGRYSKRLAKSSTPLMEPGE